MAAMNRRPLLEVAQECVFVVTGEQCDRFDECLAKLAEHGIGGTDPSLLVRLTAIAESLGVATVVPVSFNSQEPTDPPLAVKQNKRKHGPSKTGFFEFGLPATTENTSQSFASSKNKAIYCCDLCGKKCMTHSALVNHVKTHNPNAKLRSTLAKAFPKQETLSHSLRVSSPAEEDEAHQEDNSWFDEVLDRVFFCIREKERLQKEAKQDGRKKNRVGGAKKRKRYDVGTKAQCIDMFDSLVDTRGSSHGAVGIVETDFGLPQGTLGKWLKDRQLIAEAADNEKHGALKKMGSKIKSITNSSPCSKGPSLETPSDAPQRFTANETANAHKGVIADEVMI